LRNSAGRACTSANRTPVMDRASCQGTVLSQVQLIANRDKLNSVEVAVESSVGVRVPNRAQSEINDFGPDLRPPDSFGRLVPVGFQLDAVQHRKINLPLRST
jgi:hypothetical protein